MHRLLTALLALCLPMLAIAEEATTQAAIDAPTKAELLEITDGDLLHGDADAPVTIIEYSSFSCSHCAKFHNQVLPTIKTEYIDTGKVKFTNRAFPLNEPALRASMLVECIDDDERAKKFESVLFKLQSKWAFDADFLGQIKQLAAVGGVSSDEFDSCMANKELEEAILLSRKLATDVLEVQATPTFYINGTSHEGPPSIEVMRETLDALLK